MTGKIVALLIGMPPALGRDAFAGVRERAAHRQPGPAKRLPVPGPWCPMAVLAPVFI